MCSSTNLSFLSVTDQGKVLKTINAASADDSSRVTSVVIEELDVLSKPEPIRNLKIIRTMQYGEFYSSSLLRSLFSSVSSSVKDDMSN